MGRVGPPVALWMATMLFLGPVGCAHKSLSTRPGPSAERLRRELPGDWVLRLAPGTKPDQLRLSLAPDGTCKVKEIWLLVEIPGGKGTWEVEGADLVLLLRDYPRRPAGSSNEVKRLSMEITSMDLQRFWFKDAQGRASYARRVAPEGLVGTNAAYSASGVAEACSGATLIP